MTMSEWLKRKTGRHGERMPVGATSVEALLVALRDGDPAARRQAAIALGDVGDSRATGDLIRSLDDRDDVVRVEAVIALGKIGDARAVEHLIAKLKSQDYLYVRKKAAYTLYVFLKQERLDPGLREKILSHWRSWYLT
ncbi:MAG: PBS lyase HEAT-like repeat protein [Methanocella sp. PtaU1.Bin125]|nr:MAG: PBS lyase HEAT-like repeat protein [Methanocella sp. PtaU1.Bin125]